MIRRFAWLLLPSLLLPSPGANATAADTEDVPAVTRLDDIRVALVAHRDAVMKDGKATSTEKLAQYWYNWPNWPNWGNYWRNR